MGNLQKENIEKQAVNFGAFYVKDGLNNASRSPLALPCFNTGKWKGSRVRNFLFSHWLSSNILLYGPPQKTLAELGCWLAFRRMLYVILTQAFVLIQCVDNSPSYWFSESCMLKQWYMLSKKLNQWTCCLLSAKWANKHMLRMGITTICWTVSGGKKSGNAAWEFTLF